MTKRFHSKPRVGSPNKGATCVDDDTRGKQEFKERKREREREREGEGKEGNKEGRVVKFIATSKS